MRRLFFIALFALTVPVLAGEVPAGRALSQSPAAGRTPMPSPAKGKGISCVAPVDWMRRNHMKALLHQRDQTTHEGVRGAVFSLKDCVTCHAVQGADGRAVPVSDPKHFCRSCHDYAAVSIDCFECHASRPEEPSKGAQLQDSTAKDIAALAHYLEGNSP